MAKKVFLLSAIQTCRYPLFGNFNTPLSHLLPFNNNVTINHDRLISIYLPSSSVPPNKFWIFFVHENAGADWKYILYNQLNRIFTGI